MSKAKEYFIGTLVISLSAFLISCGGQEFQADKDLFSESFSQKVEKKKVDIIMVVDNSISMVHDQEKLSREFSSFISSIQDSDYRIGVITTDTLSTDKEDEPGFYGNLDTIGGNGEKFITNDSVDKEELFRLAIHREETRECIENDDFLDCVSPHETPIKALKMALEKRNTVNQEFFRVDAELGVVIITDEDETADPSDGSILSPTEFLTFFENEFSTSKLLQVFAISIPEGNETCLQEQKDETFTGTAAAYGLSVSRLAQLTGGFNVSICEDSYGNDLQRISEYVEESLLITRIRIPGEPVSSSIKLVVKDKDGNLLDISWRLNDGYLELNPAPPEGSTIDLSFRY